MSSHHHRCSYLNSCWGEIIYLTFLPNYAYQLEMEIPRPDMSGDGQWVPTAIIGAQEPALVLSSWPSSCGPLAGTGKPTPSSRAKAWTLGLVESKRNVSERV